MSFFNFCFYILIGLDYCSVLIFSYFFQKITEKKCYPHLNHAKNRNNKQEYFYSGKKKRHTIKSQIIVDKKTKGVICTDFSNGKKHDFKLFKDSRVRWTKERCGVTDSGYTRIKKIQSNSRLPKKSSKKKPLIIEEKKQNREISSD